MAQALSTHAAAAQAIRRELKAAFPAVTFKVVSKSFSMGNDVNITWTDGPTTNDVDALVAKYQQGHFDGMIDLYEYSNARDDIPQAKYVFTTRHAGRDAFRTIVDHINAYWGLSLRIIDNPEFDEPYIDRDSDTHNGFGWDSSRVMQAFAALSLLCSACNAATLPYDAFCPQCGCALITSEAA